MLSSVSSEDTIIVADLEAGIGTLTRLPEQAVDVTIIVTEPTPRSIDVAKRAVAVATERQQGRIVIAANKVSDADDEARISEAFTNSAIVILPADEVVNKADRQGLSPMDVDPHSPIIVSIAELGQSLVSSTPAN